MCYFYSTAKAQCYPTSTSTEHYFDADGVKRNIVTINECQCTDK